MIKTKIKTKYWFYENYWWLVPCILCVVSIFLYIIQSGIDLKLSLTLIGTVLSMLYFLQKQRLEETKLFRDIFTECNKRYNKMSRELNSIIEKPSEKEIEAEERLILNDYFDLCGEEYLYYRQGYIPPSVWKAWNNGMKFFIENPRIAKVWKEEKKSESYYGLPL